MQDITPSDSIVPIYLVPPTKEEIAEQETLVLINEQRKQEQQAKEDAKMSALEKLSSLGLTEEEAKAIVGL